MPAINIGNKSSKSKKTLLIKIILIVTVVALMIGLNMWRNNKYSGEPVHTAGVAEKETGEKVYASGSIELREKQEVIARDSRVLKELYVKPGDRVEKGQLLAIFEWANEERALADARAGLASEEAKYQNLLTPAEEDLAIGKAEFTEAKIAYENKLKDWNRIEALHDSGVISDQEMDVARQELSAKEASFLKAQKNYDVLNSGPRAAERKEAEAGLARAQTVLRAAEQEMSHYTIKAAIDGVVLSSDGTIGGTVKAGDKFIIIGNPEFLELNVGVSEADATRVKPGQEVTIEAAALPGEEFKGTVTEVAGLARTKESHDARQVEVPIRINVEDSTGRLKPGYTVDLEIISMAVEKRLVIPYEALVENEGIKQVWVYDEGKARLQTVTTGVESELYLEVTSGLVKDELVITDPPGGLTEGQKVRSVSGSNSTPEDDGHD